MPTPDQEVEAYLAKMGSHQNPAVAALAAKALAKAKQAPAPARVEPSLRTQAVGPIAEYGPPLPTPAPSAPEPAAAPYRALPPPLGRHAAAPTQSPQSLQLDAMRKTVQQAGAPQDGTQMASARGTPQGHEMVPERLTLLRQQAEVDEYGRTLHTTLADAASKAYESAQQGGPNFVPVRDYKNGKMYLVAASGSTFEFDTYDPADMAHFTAAMASVKLEPQQVVAWANTVSQPLKALLAPLGQPGQAPQAPGGPSMFSHAEFVNRLKQARTPAEADAIVAEHPLFGEHPEAADLAPDDPLSQRIGAPPQQAATPGAQYNTFMRGQQQQSNQELPPVQQPSAFVSPQSEAPRPGEQAHRYRQVLPPPQQLSAFNPYK